MRDVYAPIKCAQIQKQRKQDRKEAICFMAVFAILTAVYIVLGV